MDATLRVGVLANTHGIRGEVKVFPTTDDMHRFDSLKEVILDTKKEPIILHIQQVKYFKNLVILKFKEFNNINEVEKYKGCDLLVTRDNAVELEEDEYFIYDIIGAEVKLTDGRVLGTLQEVLTTNANDVYVVKPSKEFQSEKRKEILLPVIRDCVKEIDTDQKQVLVELLPGLVEGIS